MSNSRAADLGRVLAVLEEADRFLGGGKRGGGGGGGGGGRGGRGGMFNVRFHS